MRKIFRFFFFFEERNVLSSCGAAVESERARERNIQKEYRQYVAGRNTLVTYLI